MPLAVKPARVSAVAQRVDAGGGEQHVVFVHPAILPRGASRVGGTRR